MKRCHENSGAAIYVGRASTVHNPLFLGIHTTVEYLNRNVSIGQLLELDSNSIVVCARSRPNNANKNTTKKFVRLHNNCFIKF